MYPYLKTALFISVKSMLVNCSPMPIRTIELQLS